MMKRQLKKILRNRFPGLRSQYLAYKLLIKNKSSYLYSSGWMESLKQGYPCNKDGAELPWMNYAVIAFLESRLKSNLSIFEYGSGYSTLFFSRIVKSVTSVEYDKVWHEAIIKKIPSNVQLINRQKDVDGEYCRSINLTNELYDVVIVDGRDRINCLKQALEKLTDGGVVLLDDSQRKEYQDGINYVKQKYFLTIDFEGLKPAGYGSDRTTIFYRPKNCLNI